MYEDNRIVFAHDEVRCSGYSLAMQPEAESRPMQSAAHDIFGPRVFAPDARHQRAAIRCGKDIRHRSFRAAASIGYTLEATRFASIGGTAFPTWWYCSVRLPVKK